jgi:hypothetical protein
MRIKYNPEFHENYKQPWTAEDLEYMCAVWDGMKKADIAMALSRTHGAVLEKAHYLRKVGLFNGYRKRGRKKLGLE